MQQIIKELNLIYIFYNYVLSNLSNVSFVFCNVSFITLSMSSYVFGPCFLM